MSYSIPAYIISLWLVSPVLDAVHQVIHFGAAMPAAATPISLASPAYSKSLLPFLENALISRHQNMARSRRSYAPALRLPQKFYLSRRLNIHGIMSFIISILIAMYYFRSRITCRTIVQALPFTNAQTIQADALIEPPPRISLIILSTRSRNS
jgi:hypothetical protein